MGEDVGEDGRAGMSLPGGEGRADMKPARTKKKMR